MPWPVIPHSEPCPYPIVVSRGRVKSAFSKSFTDISPERNAPKWAMLVMPFCCCILPAVLHACEVEPMHVTPPPHTHKVGGLGTYTVSSHFSMVPSPWLQPGSSVSILTQRHDLLLVYLKSGLTFPRTPPPQLLGHNWALLSLQDSRPFE